MCNWACTVFHCGWFRPKKHSAPTASNSRGSVAVAHNGNITNAEALKQYLENRGAIFHSLTDTEVLLHLMAHQPHKPMIDAFVDSLRRLKGAYSLVMILDGKLVAARDPWGFRPLVIGQRDRIIYVSSETCALDLVGAKALREVAPGEVVVIDKDEIKALEFLFRPSVIISAPSNMFISPAPTASWQVVLFTLSAKHWGTAWLKELHVFPQTWSQGCRIAEPSLLWICGRKHSL